MKSNCTDNSLRSFSSCCRARSKRLAEIKPRKAPFATEYLETVHLLESSQLLCSDVNDKTGQFLAVQRTGRCYTPCFYHTTSENEKKYCIETFYVG